MHNYCHLFIGLLVGLPFGGCADSYRIEESEATVSGIYDGEVLWTYNHAAHEGKPYFHPLKSTGGTVFTDLRPKDHPWHRGVWFSWKMINGVNYWEENHKTGKSEGETRPVGFAWKVLDRKSVKFDVEIDYAPAGSGEVILREQRTVLVSAPDARGAYTVDWFGRFEAVKDAVELNRTPLADEAGGKSWGGYAGWSVRMNEAMRGGIFVNSRGSTGADREEADWMRFQAPSGDGLLFMDHPQNFNYPCKWYLHDGMPFFNAAVIHDGPHRIPAGGHLALRYRLLVSPGGLDDEGARQAWREWTGSEE